MSAGIWIWIARGVCLAVLVSLVIRNSETGTIQALPIAMGIALLASFLYPLLTRKSRERRANLRT